MKPVKIILVGIALVVSVISAFGAEIDAGLIAFQSGRYPEALRILLPLANSGNDEAQRVVGEMCYGGKGMKRDLLASFKWTELAAESGNRIGQYNLGYLYERGEGVPASRVKSIDWYIKSAVQGYFAAQHKLGDIYSTSQRSKAIYWYELAAQSGDEVARKKFSVLSSQNVAEATAANKQQQAERDLEVQREEEEQRARHARADYERQMANQESSSGSLPRNSTPFDGLDAINKVMRDGQRRIAVARAENVTGAAARDSSRDSARESVRESVRDNDHPQPAVTQRTVCIFENRTNSSDYSEAVARATLQKEINGVKALMQNSVGDPARYLSDSGITCQKEAGNINPEYKCAVSIKTEVKLLGPCGNSGSTTVRSK